MLSQAFYQRGLTKMKLKHAKGIHDFNRALAINPTLFQVSKTSTLPCLPWSQTSKSGVKYEAPGCRPQTRLVSGSHLYRLQPRQQALDMSCIGRLLGSGRTRSSRARASPLLNRLVCRITSSNATSKRTHLFRFKMDPLGLQVSKGD